jgi:P-type Mg2+ transporter
MNKPGRGPPAARDQAAASIRALACLSESEALSRLGSRRAGLSGDEVEQRRATHGLNQVASEKPPTWYQQLWRACQTPFNYILLVLAALSYVTGDVKALTVIGSMVVLSTMLRFLQEYRSNRAALALQAMVRTRATVLRTGLIEAAGPDRGHDVGIEELVPGDIVLLCAGDMVPADVRILSAKDLFLSQSALTGESAPVEKRDAPLSGLSGDLALPELRTIGFMGTNVVSGSATALVVATGGQTVFGGIARDLLGRIPPTAFDLGVNRVSWLLIRFMLVMVPVVFLANGLTKGDWLQAFLFGLAVAVGLTPEMLPMVVTTNLAKGAVAMSGRKTIVKRLNAIQNLGAMDVLCTDKTGTLTQDRIVLERHVNAVGEEDEHVLELAYLNSYHQTGLHSLLDTAVLQHRELHAALAVERDYRKIDEIPFDFSRRRMTVVVEHEGERTRHLLISKGAVEEILAVCRQVRDEDRVLELTDRARAEVADLVREQNEDGLRVVAVAYREFAPERRAYSALDEHDLILAGFISFLDPPKETAAPALKALRGHGIAVKILTGDNDLVARKVCHDVGLEPGRVLLGPELAALTDSALADATEQTVVFARLTPDQKVRVVRALRGRDHTVGFMGDGINDAAALREADVGISVDTAVDIARESADIILLEKSLMVLSEGVEEGRRTFGNIMKYLKMTASSNFGNVLSVMVASVILPFLPMLPIQLLAQNLLYDISQVAIPWDGMDPEYLIVPRRWSADDIGRFMLHLGPVSSLFDMLTFAVLWFVYGATSPEQQALFQSGWFVVGLLTQTLIVHMIRTQRLPFIESRAALPVLVTTAMVMAAGALLPYTHIGTHLSMVPLPVSFFGFVLLLLTGYAILVHRVKVRYLRRFGRWL